MKHLTWVLDLLFPPKCCFCGRILEHTGICEDCGRTLPRTEGEAVRELSGGLRCAAPLWYEGTVREALLGLKFRGDSWAAEPLGALAAECAAEAFSGEFDVVTWVPVSRKRRRKRGYDQAELLARSICRCWETAPVQMLKKAVDNPAQSGISERSARRANVLGVYDPVRLERISGQRILLVDDICTTGATLEECARVLRDAGAAQVMALTVAQGRKKEGNPASSGGNTQENGTKSR